MLLEVDTISTYYGPIKALKKVSLHVNPGEIVALIGANGAGKTTLLNSISGLMNPRCGRVIFKGRDITRFSPVQTVGLGINHVPEHRQLFGTMTVYDNLLLGAYHRSQRAGKQELEGDLDRAYELFPILKERRRQMAGTLSGGEQQMLAIARGLMARPELMLLDEPSLGLAPLITRELFRIIARLCETGQTFLLVEQNARAALKLAHRAYVIETGRVVLEGEAKKLLADERVQAAYLGAGGVGGGSQEGRGRGAYH